MFSEEKKSNFCGLIHLSRKVRTAALASTILPLHQFLFRMAYIQVWHPGRIGMTCFRRNCRQQVVCSRHDSPPAQGTDTDTDTFKEPRIAQRVIRMSLP